MIVSFGNKLTKRIYDGEKIKELPVHLQELARRKLRMMHNSEDLNDLKIPPSNRLEKLKGNLKEYYSIRINDQWRIIFRWNNGQASDVEILDYH